MPELTDLTGVRFTPSGKLQYFDAAGIALAAGDRALVETDDGECEGIVAIAPGQVAQSDLRGPLNRVIRKLDSD